MNIATENFQAKVLQPYRTDGTPRAEQVSHILRELIRHETVFTDYERGCEDLCFECEECLHRMQVAANMLNRHDSLVWEVWSMPPGEVDLVGIIYLTRITMGQDATGHFAFFDEDLIGKRALLEAMIQWAFKDHEEMGWEGLRRITVKVPDFAYALARFVTEKLGFGGDYEYTDDNFEVPVEGVKREALLWRDEWRDHLILGRTR